MKYPILLCLAFALSACGKHGGGFAAGAGEPGSTGATTLPDPGNGGFSLTFQIDASRSLVLRDDGNFLFDASTNGIGPIVGAGCASTLDFGNGATQATHVFPDRLLLTVTSDSGTRQEGFNPELGANGCFVPLPAQQDVNQFLAPPLLVQPQPVLTDS